MSTKTVSKDDSGSSSLTKVFKRLTFRSPAPPTSSSSSSPSPSRPPKPLPVSPSYPSQQRGAGPSEQETSLPPYLAHLAEPSSSYSQTSPVRFPQPSVPKHPTPRPLHSANQSSREDYADPSRLPPRPPAFVPARGSQSTFHPIHDFPDSLKAGSISVAASSTQKQTYPWELVPQRKPVASSPVQTAPRPDKGCRILTPKDPSPPTEVKTPSRQALMPTEDPPMDVKTPPRRPGLQASVANTWLTPNGSQPVKGQCWGIKKDGTRCTRKDGSISSPAQSPSPSRSYRGTSAPPRLLKGTSATSAQDGLVISSSDEDISGSHTATTASLRSATPSGPSASDSASLSDGDDADEWYCFQHVAEAKKWPGFYHSYTRYGSSSATSEVFIKYDDWLGTTSLTDRTQALMRHRMSRNLTETDRTEKGHLYIHELMACSTPTHICLKVGRSIKVFRRIGEWNSQCRSKQPLLRAIYPSDATQELMPGMDTPTMEGMQFSRRWEALVHLELAGIGRRVDEECHDCRRRHREIFMIPRRLGPNDGYDTAKQVILKWLRFVQLLSSPNTE
ncbi:hypothetical protein EX895_004534 [Sporisorium graminicola]|uniref:Bacteriophage T5 Orf172 DNA-binding domain-containing protein n=1 Tax=Sporisorium graminicola TaxID=280036 RepID=A0A4U7KPI3_9BASI|nr:hypothetical protein EX895_004534 [Sporisorium graminicola]TKY86385.1 hypothetical protein EX895_004534 [Sporisorium graminicola]